jgi:hypothetical protein
MVHYEYQTSSTINYYSINTKSSVQWNLKSRMISGKKIRKKMCFSGARILAKLRNTYDYIVDAILLAT